MKNKKKLLNKWKSKAIKKMENNDNDIFDFLEKIAKKAIKINKNENNRN